MNYKHYIDNGHAQFDKNDCLWQNTLEAGEGWRASDCNTKLPFLCKTPADPSATISTSEPRECPDDWTEFSGACYLHQRTLVSWYGAAYECEALGSVLTSVLSREEEQFINKLAAGTGMGTFHLGGYIANTWKWLDGSPVTVIHSVTLTYDASHFISVQLLELL